MLKIIVATVGFAVLASTFPVVSYARDGDGDGNRCKDLRRACMYKERLGEVGEGNCKLYRRTCK